MRETHVSRYLAGALTILLLFVSLRVVHGQEEKYAIVAGERTGNWNLGGPLDSLGLGKPQGHWTGDARGIPYYDGFAFGIPSIPYLSVSTCRSDELIFAILVVRRLDLPDERQREVFNYRAKEGIGIGTSEEDVQRQLSRAPKTGQWTERQGGINLTVVGLDYPGLRILVNRNDGRVFGLGATTRRGWSGCLEGAVGPAGPDHPDSIVQLGVPIPRRTHMQLPSPDVPANRAVWIGKWFGTWSSPRTSVPHMLIVEEVRTRAPYVIAVYAYGGVRPGWFRTTGFFSDEQLHLETAFGAPTYRMTSNDTASGTFEGLSGTLGVVLKRVLN